jgi:hypothetical protein
MKKILLLLFLFTCSFGKYTYSQQGLYSADTIREMRIYFAEANWDYILDSLYVEGLQSRLAGTVVIDGQSFASVGIRYKGFSSASVTRVKNPFNFDLDYVVAGQNYEGYDKIKLSNVIQDPSFMREVLSYEIARKYMPASEANFANLYINDTLWGLYTNVEAVNKDFLKNKYGSRDYTFVKGNPSTVDLNGDNSNLGLSYGTDTADYYPYYDMKSDFGWRDLYSFLDTLNNHIDSIHNVLNVDRTLWMHALNYSLINFDSYVGYAQNYYMYQDDNRRFNPILWDMNQSFASYRLTDNSDYWGGFTGTQAASLDPLAHYNSFSVYDRPLMRNLFNDDRSRRMYVAHIRTIMEENIVNSEYYNRGLALQALIDTSVANDTNKFYSYTDFQDNLTVTVTDLVDYPGLTELMDARAIYMATVLGYQGAPTIDTITPSNSFTIGGSVDLTTQAYNADNVLLAYRFGSREVFEILDMFDDGLHNDGAAGDSVYGATIPNVSNYIQYYFYAENDSAGRFSPVRAAYEYYEMQTQISPLDLVLNEFMASNTITVTDEAGEYDDWIEIYNNTAETLSTKGLYLSDSSSYMSKWEIPDLLIGPDDYQIVWADAQNEQSGQHANFHLDKLGEFLSLAYDDGTIIDSLTYPAQFNDFTYGRYPNGTGPYVFLTPTFGYTNSITELEEINELSFHIFPNPASNKLIIELDENSVNTKLELYSIDGKNVFNQTLLYSREEVILPSLSDGVYLIKVSSYSQTSTKRLIINQNH